LKADGVKDRDFDVHNFLYVLRPYYKGGEFDYLLNATENLDVMQQPFIVFELDNVKDHPILFPVITLIIMEMFISKMRKLKGVRKVIVIEEAWKAIAKNGMAEFLKYLYKTVRKYFGEAITVTQEIDDIISSPVIKEAIINNADCKILLDMKKFQNKFDAIQAVMGMTDKGREQVLSVNKANDHNRKYRELYIELGNQLMKVYRYEPSIEEYYAYSTEQTEKLKVQEYTRKYGDIRKGLTALVRDLAA
jgi:conjugation system TraG family ATPase